MYAIVDIETTGGSAQNSGITEIAILLHNGTSVEGQYQTLINPEQPVPSYITALTGITNSMLTQAPTFAQVAHIIHNLLSGRVFVAHNVNFDYSFIHHFLQQNQIAWQAKKLCTVRYARKVFPGQKSYSLGNITRHLGIAIQNRHRAMGDAEATVQLLEKCLQHDEAQKHLHELLKGKNPHSYLPMHVPQEQIEALPYSAGIYFFHNQEGKIIYVGKAKNLKFRVKSHFTNNNPNQRKQDLARKVHSITHQHCATELMALVLEALEIKRLWPEFNRSQKKFEQVYGLYTFEDQNGLQRLTVEKKRKHLPALHHLHRLSDGYALGRQLISLFNMQEQLVFATAKVPQLSPAQIEQHNLQMQAAIQYLQTHLPTFGIVQSGINELGATVQIGYLLVKGAFFGMGYLPPQATLSFASFQAAVTQYPDYDFVRHLLQDYVTATPLAKIVWEQ